MAMPAVGTETPRSDAKPGSTPMLANSVVPIASPPSASAARLTPAGTRERRVGRSSCGTIVGVSVAVGGVTRSPPRRAGS